LPVPDGAESTKRRPCLGDCCNVLSFWGRVGCVSSCMFFFLVLLKRKERAGVQMDNSVLYEHT
jgi:hypothetical protein